MTRAASPMLLVLILWCAGLGSAAQFAKLGVVFDIFAAAYPGHGEAVLGLAISVVGFVGLVFGTTAGLLVQRFGYRRVLVLALGGGALLSALQAMLPPLPLLMGLRLLEGFSHLAIVVAAPVLIAQVAPLARQGLAMTLWSSFFAVCFALTAWAGRPLALNHGLGALLLAHAGYMTVFAGLLAVLLPRDVPQAPAPLSFGSLLRQHGTIYASPMIAAPALGFFCYTVTYVALLTLLPPLFGAWQAMVAAAFPLVSIAVSLTLGVWLLKQVSAVAIVQGGFALAVLGAMLLGAGWSVPPLALTGACMIAAALGLVQGASFAAIPQLNAAAADRAAAAGAIAQLGNLGTTTGTPILALLIAGQGMAGLALFVLIPSALGILLHLWLSARRRSMA